MANIVSVNQQAAIRSLAAQGWSKRRIARELSPVELNRCLARYLNADLLTIDDMGLKTLPPKAGEILLEIILRRYENRSTLMTSNRPMEDWGKLLNDVPTATAILDRFLHHAQIIQITGRRYRLRQPRRPTWGLPHAWKKS
jgi:DNA replication protein DnaC